jgi:hypothetical protein
MKFTYNADFGICKIDNSEQSKAMQQKIFSFIPVVLRSSNLHANLR